MKKPEPPAAHRIYTDELTLGEKIGYALLSVLLVVTFVAILAWAYYV